MSELLSPEDAKVLMRLCRAGRLYEIEKWIAAGRSIRTSADFKKAPLHVAIDLGFHSLVELLARNEPCQALKDKALGSAVSKKRLDLVELLVTHGAQLRSVDLDDVLLNWEPTMIRYFLDNGADVVTRSPFAMAFREKVRTALRPFVEYKKAHPESATQLQAQADRALRYFAAEGDLKWVSLMLWAGANPRTSGPTFDERYEDDPECHTTALREAAYAGKVDVLMKFKPDPQTDNIADLLRCAVLSRSNELFDYLFGLGANPNDKASGGSSALDEALLHLNFEDRDAFTHNRLASRYALSGALDRLRRLVEHGAQWKPDDDRDLRWVRQTLCKCEAAVTVDIVKLFAKNKACSEETLEKLLDTPRIRGHLSQLGMNLYVPPSTRSRRTPQPARPAPSNEN